MSRTLISEIKKMKELFNAEHGVHIFEQVSYEQMIGQQILSATSGFGTNEAKLLSAIKSFKDATAFWNTNSWLKKNGGKDIFQIVGSEMESDNISDIENISAVLKGLGINTTFEKTQSGGYKPYSFRHGGNAGGGIAAGAAAAAKAAASAGKAIADTVVTAKGSNKGRARKGGGTSTTQRFQKIQQQVNPGSSGKMDVENLQQILNKLEGGQGAPAPTTPAAGATPGQPDVAMLNQALSQLA